MKLEMLPESPRKQISKLLVSIPGILGNNLIGLYLHGSLAMGCFNEDTSDIDLLGVTQENIQLNNRKDLIDLLLSISKKPHPIEISFMRSTHLIPWHFPTPYSLHYSETWRTQYESDLLGDKWTQWNLQENTDNDLAAHVTITRTRGICLLGRNIQTAFPRVPSEDYLSSIESDMTWAIERIDSDPVYAVLNSCRVYAYVKDGIITSKEEGGIIGKEYLPKEFHPIIETAIDIYRGKKISSNKINQNSVKELLEYIRTKIRTG